MSVLAWIFGGVGLWLLAIGAGRWVEQHVRTAPSPLRFTDAPMQYMIVIEAVPGMDIESVVEALAEMCDGELDAVSVKAKCYPPRPSEN